MPVADLKRTPLLLGEHAHLFGYRTAPEEGSAGIGAIILNAGLLHNVGPFRLHVDLADALAGQGIPVVRIDQSGKGESPRRPGPGMSRTQRLVSDYRDAYNALFELGVERTILVGLCSGADDALLIAQQEESVTGLVLLDGYARKTARFHARRLAAKLTSTRRAWHALARRLSVSKESRGAADALADFNIRDWLDDTEMVQLIASLLDSNRKILAVFTSGQDYYNYGGQLKSNVKATARPENLEEIYYADADHTYSRCSQRQDLINRICRWAANFPDSGA